MSVPPGAEPGGAVDLAVAPDPAPAHVPPVDEPRLRLSVAVLLVVVAVVVALVVVGAVLTVPTDPVPSGPALDPPTAEPTGLALTVDGKQVTFREFRATLPGAPFTCLPVRSLAGTFLTYLPCAAVVDKNYDGKGTNSYANVALVVPAAGLVDPHDARHTASMVFQAVVEGSYPSTMPTTVPLVTRSLLYGITPGKAAGTAYGDVHYRLAGKAASDRLLVVAVQLASGQTVVFFSIEPREAGAAVKQQIQTSFRSVSATG